ncbi:MAG: putative membrane protein, partial [Candidatus Falkowbacteria bacterium GW2011_GWA2_41_14]
MIKKIFNFVSFLVISSLVLSVPLTVLAQDAGTIPPPGDSSGGFQQPMQQPSSGGSFGSFQQPMDSQQYQQPMTGTQQQPMTNNYQNQNFQQPTGNFGQQQPMSGTQQQPYSGQNSGNTASCMVNGVNMPGGCDQWNQSMGTSGQGQMGGQEGQGMMGGQQGQFGGPQQGMMGQDGQQSGQFGPSDEQMEKMEKMREAQEKKMRIKGLQQAKKGMTQFLKALKNVQVKVAKFEKQGISVSADIKSKIDEAVATIEAIINATEMTDEIQEKMESMQEMGDVMQDIMPKLEMMSRLPQMIKKAQTEIKRLEKAYASAAKKATRAKVDVSSVLGNWQAAIDELKNNLAAAASGQFEEGEDPMQSIGEGVFENLENAWKYDQIIRMALDVKRNLRNVESMLKKYEKNIARLEKKGEDMMEVKEVLAMMKEKYAEVKDIAWDKLEPEEIEDFMSGLDGYMEMQQQMEEMLNLSGPSMFEQQMKQGPAKEDKMPGMNVPNFGQLMKANEDAQNQFVQQWSVTEEKLLAQFDADKVAKLKRLSALLEAAKKEVAALNEAGMGVPSDLLAALGFSSVSSVAVK